MKKMITIPLTIIMLFAFGAALYFTEQNVTKAYADDPPICTDCNISCYEIDEICYLRGTFCLNSNYVGDWYFWYRLDRPESPWYSVTMSTQTLACENGCTGYILDWNPVIRCDDDRYFWKVTKGGSDLEGECSGIFYPDGDCEHIE
jgi:hypothetical protein